MASTTNFNWSTPDDTSLVKDGAAAIRTLGQSIDTSMAELKGGTTGQVLSKTSNTDMDFTWVAADDTNAIQNTIVDAKGDLIAASANDTPARLAVGNNGETLLADSTTSTGLRYQSAYHGNVILNGAFDIWQRGTTIANTATYTFAPDRWQQAASTAQTTTRQASGLTGFQYCARVQRNSGSTSTTVIALGVSIESADSYRFAGQTVTFSFYARAGANYSNTGNLMAAYVQSGTGTDQNQNSGFTGATAIISQNSTLTTSWQRFSYTGTVASNATELGVTFYYTPTGTAGANDYFEVTGAQLELGSVATTFKRAGGGLIQQELAACQRYYYVNTSADGAYNRFGTGIAISATQAYFTVTFPVQMRTAPASITVAGNIGATTATGSAINNGTLTLDSPNRNMSTILMSSTSGLVAGNTSSILANNTTSASLAFSAEL